MCMTARPTCPQSSLVPSVRQMCVPDRRLQTAPYPRITRGCMGSCGREGGREGQLSRPFLPWRTTTVPVWWAVAILRVVYDHCDVCGAVRHVTSYLVSAVYSRTCDSCALIGRLWGRCSCISLQGSRFTPLVLSPLFPSDLNYVLPNGDELKNKGSGL